MAENSRGCKYLPEKVNSRWWIGGSVFRCAVVLSLLTFPTNQCLEDTAHTPTNTHNVYYTWAEVNLTYIDPIKQKVVHETSKGKYGANSLVEERSGLVVHVRNKKKQNHGCDEYHPGIKLPKEKWIALVERGICLFTDKIKMATKTSNASAVIIYNYKDDHEMTIMLHKVEDQVSIFVAQQTGRKLAELADKGVRVMITISPGEKARIPPNAHSTISKTSVLFVSISFIVLMIISLAWLVFYYIQRFRYAHAKERLARRLASAAKKAIAKIPQKTVRNGDKELETDFDQCAVCIEGYRPHDVIRTLPCKHVYHKSCVDPWLLDQRSCPMCKLDILRAYGMQVFGSQESVAHPDAESGRLAMAVDDHEPSSTTDDQATGDTEVKVLLLPHTCLHFHPHHSHTHHDLASSSGESASASGSGSGSSASAFAGGQDASCHSPSCVHYHHHHHHHTSATARCCAGAGGASTSTDRLSCASSSAEMQALMAPHVHGGDDDDDDEEEEVVEEEEDEGFDERHRCPLKSTEECLDLRDALPLVVRMPSEESRSAGERGEAVSGSASSVATCETDETKQ